MTGSLFQPDGSKRNIGGHFQAGGRAGAKALCPESLSGVMWLKQSEAESGTSGEGGPRGQRSRAFHAGSEEGAGEGCPGQGDAM